MGINLQKYLSRLSTPLFLAPVNKLSWEKRVLMIRDDALGDFLLFSGILRRYLDWFRDKNVYLLVDKKFLDAGKLYLPEERLITVDKKLYYSNFRYRIELINSIRGIGFSTIISSIHRSSICDDLAKYSGGIEKYGYEGEKINSKRKSFYLYNHQITSLSREVQKKDKMIHVVEHEVQMYQKMTNQELTLSEAFPYIPLEKLNNNLNDPYFILLPEAGNPRRAYSIGSLIKIASQLTEEYQIKCVILGNEKNIEIKQDDNLINLIGKTSIGEALGIIKNAEFVLGNETGLTHAAWIMKIPTIMIYGGGHFGRFLPLNDYGKVVYKRMDCYLCNWKCKFDCERFKCIEEILPKQITEEIQQILREKRGRNEQNIGNSQYPQ